MHSIIIVTAKSGETNVDIKMHMGEIRRKAEVYWDTMDITWQKA